MDAWALGVSIFAVLLTVVLFLVRLPRVTVEHSKDTALRSAAPDGVAVDSDGYWVDAHGNRHPTEPEQRFRVVVVNHGRSRSQCGLSA